MMQHFYELANQEQNHQTSQGYPPRVNAAFKFVRKNTEYYRSNTDVANLDGHFQLFQWPYCYILSFNCNLLDIIYLAKNGKYNFLKASYFYSHRKIQLIRSKIFGLYRELKKVECFEAKQNEHTAKAITTVEKAALSLRIR